MRSDYVRGTFVNPLDVERLTCAVNLVYSQDGTQVQGPDLFVIETKSADGRGAADAALSAMRIRPVSMRKYCIGIALLHPHLAANKWSRLLKQKFGWDRIPVYVSAPFRERAVGPRNRVNRPKTAPGSPSSHSHTTSDEKPSAASASRFCPSRSRVRLRFAAQNCRFVAGACAPAGQSWRCQKHPLMKMTCCRAAKVMSGLPGNLFPGNRGSGTWRRSR